MINLSNIISYGRGTLPNLIEHEQIFEKVKYFYLGKEDEEFLGWDTKSSQPCLAKVSEDDGDVAVLPLDCSKFAAVGDFETLEKLNSLMNEKELTELDIELIFSAIRLKEGEGRD